ncbi:MAG: ethanolamine ammonia-lyase reactivating factor EutA [Pseudoflavonifractor capillosus]|uniref:ethanolamine ammonia-lyase reactivating factor EutA n=1 Tax=Pseudoflavonifractor capillosus TaxID=106588 RepID=UPI0011DE2576|nr:ethanolamine ammonia-lyase reactivating factor EutA [Pseudoflavonifractor capillosus]MCI5927362.1 ethanolamine ammonia-lyase reactivating factor EutA [Pseudoflavonifractor capillosus]MDY4660535.1 ethanolamine ammonia-lyase reactivating factor EutA [Pseudoflavonifractor capillosus]
MHEVILSVGIDIGTSTTQLIFSRLTIENQASSYTVPRINIVDKEVIYRSRIYFTPLRSPTEIDAEAVKKIVRSEYRAAGITPEELKTGAVIITGETARKENANEVLSALSDLAGDFVVATAGPDLESVLSGRGAGADVLSKEKHTTVANLDIGGGTTNIALYEKGTLRGTCCLDVGGRLIKVADGRISYIYPKIQALAKDNGIEIKVGDRAYPEQLYGVCRLMAAQLAQALHLAAPDGHHAGMYTNDGRALPPQPQIQAVTYSGGVADCIYQKMEDDVFRFGDVGVLLGKAVRADPDLNRVELCQAAETIRATVVGAGTHTTEVSGSTIRYERDKLPIKNVPILKVSQEDEESLETLKSSIIQQMPLFAPEGKVEQIAIAFTGEKRTSFADVQALAAAVIESAKEVIQGPYPLIVVVENDIGKVLGNALNVLLEHKKDVICIDGIKTLSGDYIDIGEPIAGGQVLPVVIKTLIFNS